MNDYHYIYQDMQGRWNEAKNPRFIAEIQCIAVSKKVTPNIHKHLQMLNS